MGTTKNADGQSIYDGATGGAITIDAVHHEVHEGEMFVSTDLATFNGTRQLLFTTGAKEVHIVPEFVCDGPLNVTIYRAPTATASATKVTPINANHVSTNVALTDVCHTPTAVTAGSDIVDRYFNGGNANGSNKVGAGSRANDERIWKPNTKYLVSMVTASSLTVLARFHFYEE
jgi:hypothetical protein